MGEGREGSRPESGMVWGGVGCWLAGGRRVYWGAAGPGTRAALGSGGVVWGLVGNFLVGRWCGFLGILGGLRWIAFPCFRVWLSFHNLRCMFRRPFSEPCFCLVSFALCGGCSSGSPSARLELRRTFARVALWRCCHVLRRGRARAFLLVDVPRLMCPFTILCGLMPG